MAPIHHHFEMKAWSETKIMVRFWIVTASSARRVRALLPLLPRVPLSELPGRVLVLGLARVWARPPAAAALERCAGWRSSRRGRREVRRSEDDLSLSTEWSCW